MLACIALSLFPIYTFAESSSADRKKINYQLPHINQAIILDGQLDESVWKDALVIELNYETVPGENITPSVKTEVYLFEDGETLYVGFDAHDNNPQAIRDFLLDRDNVWASDFVGIKFDTFGESRKAFQFFTNARGIQADAIQEDFRGDDGTWDAIWDSKAKINQQGYVVEMAIPFQALRFPATGKKQSWGFEILRFLPRKNVHRIANAPVDRSIACSICQYDQLQGFAKVKESKNLRLVPTLTLSKNETRDFDQQGRAGPWISDELNRSLGLDFRWGITPETYLNATINPDFSQIEADSAQLDVNNTFSLFVNEKRPFFLEGSDYFNSLNRLVHTRNIVSPDYGVKITGQTENHSYGLIAAKDQTTSLLLPGNQGSSQIILDNLESENRILRYSYDLGNTNNIGLLVTSKTADDYSNQVTAVDGKYWFNQAHSLSFQIINTKSHYSQQIIASIEEALGGDDIPSIDLSDSAFDLRYDYQTRNWNASARYVDIGKDFRADLGFIRKADFKRSRAGLRRIWFPEKSKAWWNRLSFGGRWDRSNDSKDRLLEQESRIDMRLQADYQSVANLGFTQRKREWNGIYYDENFHFLFATFEPIAGLKLSINYRDGKSIDFINSRLGRSKQTSPSIDWQINQHLLATIKFIQQKFEVVQGELFTAQITNLRFGYLFDERSTLRFTLQLSDTRKNPALYNSFNNGIADDDEQKRERFLATQLLYSYTINPQTLFFAGYSDQGFQDDRISRIEKEQRSVFLKFSYAWQL